MVSTITPHAAFKDLTALSKEELVAQLKAVDTRINKLQSVILRQVGQMALLSGRIETSEREYAILLSDTEGKIQLLTEQITALTAKITELTRRAALSESVAAEEKADYLKKLRVLEEAFESERRERKDANEKFAAFTKELKDAVDKSSKYACSGMTARHEALRIILTATVDGLKKYCG